MNPIAELTRVKASCPSVREPASNYAQANAAFFIALMGMTHPPLARHSRHVAELVRAFARHLRMTETLQEELYTVALFHDIGLLRKYAVDSSDLVMKEPTFILDESDQGHAAEGARLVGLLPEFSRGANWIRHHHERYDGGGYPGGLRANSIPLGSRIITIADIFDRICFERGESEAGAIKLMFTESGGAFDPQLVESFAIFTSCE
ncbi:MAG: HD domain-containing phosphohydrolase [Spirochaetota bacterium]